MSNLRIRLDGPAPSHRPGDVLRGAVLWGNATTALVAELRLGWILRSAAAPEVGIVSRLPLTLAADDGERAFALPLPAGPWSFQGLFTHLEWFVEVAGTTPSLHTHQFFTLSPDGAPRRRSALPPRAEDGGDRPTLPGIS